MEKLKHVLSKLLICFALISIGYAFGKHSVKHRNNNGDLRTYADKNYIAVYYMHSTFRCSTCNRIEGMTKALLDKAYSSNMASGQIQWQDVDFQENEVLANKFEVIASCVVVANMSNGSILEFKRLDEVWTLMAKPKEFDSYISNAINTYLKKDGGKQ